MWNASIFFLSRKMHQNLKSGISKIQINKSWFGCNFYQQTLLEVDAEKGLEKTVKVKVGNESTKLKEILQYFATKKKLQYVSFYWITY